MFTLIHVNRARKTIDVHVKVNSFSFVVGVFVMSSFGCQCFIRIVLFFLFCFLWTPLPATDKARKPNLTEIHENHLKIISQHILYKE